MSGRGVLFHSEPRLYSGHGGRSGRYCQESSVLTAACVLSRHSRYSRHSRQPSWKLKTGHWVWRCWWLCGGALAWWLCECSVVIMQCHCKLTLFYSWECCAVNSTEEVFTVHSGIAIRSMWTNCKWLLTHVIEVTQKSKSRFFFNIYWVFHCYCMIEFLNYKVAPLCCVVSVAVPSKLRSWCCLACAVVGSLDQ